MMHVVYFKSICECIYEIGVCSDYSLLQQVTNNMGEYVSSMSCSVTISFGKESLGSRSIVGDLHGDNGALETMDQQTKILFK